MKVRVTKERKSIKKENKEKCLNKKVRVRMKKVRACRQNILPRRAKTLRMLSTSTAMPINGLKLEN